MAENRDDFPRQKDIMCMLWSHYTIFVGTTEIIRQPFALATLTLISPYSSEGWHANGRWSRVSQLFRYTEELINPN